MDTSSCAPVPGVCFAVSSHMLFDRVSLFANVSCSSSSRLGSLRHAPHTVGRTGENQEPLQCWRHFAGETGNMISGSCHGVLVAGASQNYMHSVPAHPVTEKRDWVSGSGQDIEDAS